MRRSVHDARTRSLDPPRRAARNEHGFLADFLLPLADFDRNAMWRELGYPSLFLYLHKGLKLSKGAAHNRKTAAELIQAYSQVEAALRSGELCLTTVTELARVLTPDNASQVLPRFSGLSRREAEAVAVSLLPPAVIPTREVITLLPPPMPREVTRSAAPALHLQLGTAVPPGEPTLADASIRAAATSLSPATVSGIHPDELPGSTDEETRCIVGTPVAFSLAPAPSPATDPVQPVPSAGAARLHLTVSAEFLEKLEKAKDALGHAIPHGGHAEILERGLDLVLAEAAKRKGLVEKPQTKIRPAKREHVPAHVKREVWQRAGGRCECTLPTGERCDETLRLEYDHVPPLALGGVSTVATVRLACRAHNQLAARQALGDRLMDRHAGKRAPARARLVAGEEDLLVAIVDREPEAREPVAAYASPP